MPRPATCTSRRSSRPRRGGCCKIRASGRWRSSSAATGWTFADFEEIGTVDRERFPAFTDELREAMFEEPVRFLLDVFQTRPLGPRFPLRATTRS